MLSPIERGRIVALVLWSTSACAISERLKEECLSHADCQERLGAGWGCFETRCAPQLVVARQGDGAGTVRSEPAGIDCGDGCTAIFPLGTMVTLRATPAMGATFGGWSDSCSGTAACTLTMTQSSAVGARFDVPAELMILPNTAAIAVDEGGPPRRLSIGLYSTPSEDLEVVLSTGDTAIATVAPPSLRFMKGGPPAPQDVSISAASDDDARHETTKLVVTLAGRRPIEIPISVRDDDDLGLFVSTDTLRLREGGEMDVEVGLTAKPDSPVTVDLRASDSAKLGVAPPELTIQPDEWMRRQTVRISSLRDRDLRDEVLEIEVNAGEMPARNIRVEVTDPDAQRIVTSTAPIFIDEGTSTTLDIALESEPEGMFTVAIASTNPAAFSVSPSMFTFTAADHAMPRSITLSAAEDSDTRHERADLTLSAPGLARITIPVNIVDEDEQRVLTSTGTVFVDELGTTTFTVRLTANPLVSTPVLLSSADGGRVSVSPPRLTFGSADYAMPRTVTVSGLMDDDARPQQVFVNLESLVAPNARVLVNLRDGNAQAIVATPTSLSLSEDGTATFDVRLAFNPLGPARIALTSLDTSAAVVSPAEVIVEPADYQQPHVVTVSGVSDLDVASETTEIRLSSPGIAPDLLVPITVTDPDPQAIRINPSALPLDEGASATVGVRLDFEPTVSLSVNVAPADPSLAAATPQVLTFTAANYATPQPVTITAANDEDMDDHSTEIVFASGPLRAGVAVSTRNLDVQEIVTSTRGVRVIEGGAVTFNARLRFRPTSDVSVAIDSSDPTAVAAETTALTFSPSNYATPQSITVRGVVDDDTAGESASLRLRAGNVTVSIPVSVTDPDPQSIMATVQQLTVLEGRTATIGVRLRFRPSADLTAFAATNEPGLVTATPAILSFSATNFAAYQRITLTGVSDLDTVGGATTLVINTPGVPNLVIPVNVTDDDPQSLIAVPNTVTVNEGQTSSFTLRLAFQPPGDVLATVTSTDTGAATVMPGTLVFTRDNYQIPQIVVVSGVPDVDAFDEAPNVVVSAPRLRTVVPVSVVDPQAVNIQVEPASLSLVEGGTAGVFTVRLSREPLETVTVSLTSSDPTSAILSSNALVFTPATASVPQMVTVTAPGDDDADGETISIRLAAAGLTERAVTLTTADPDVQSIVSSVPNVAVNEGSTQTFTVRLAFNPRATKVVTIASNDTGVAATAPTALTFTSANFAVPQTVTVSGVHDIDLAPESTTLTLSTAQVPDRTVMVNVSDDDQQAVVLSRDVVDVGEGEQAIITANLAFVPAANTTVMLVSGDAGAASLAPSVLTFTPAAFNVPQQITITAPQDDDVRHESVTLTVSSAGLPGRTALIRVRDDDVQRFILSASAVAIAESTSGSFNVSLAFEPTGTATVTPISSVPGKLSTTPAVLYFDRASYRTPRQVTVASSMDNDVADEQVNVFVRSAVVPTATVSVNIDDPDVQVVEVSSMNVLLVEGTTATFTVRLRFNPLQNATVSLSSADATSLTVSPATLVFTPENFGTPQTVTLIAAQDNDAADEMVAVNLSSPVAQNRVVTVSLDDPDVQRILLNPSMTLNLLEPGTASMRVSLAYNPITAATVVLSSADSSALTVAPASLTFNSANYSAEQMVTLTAVADGDAQDELVDVTATSPVAAQPSVLRVSVTDASPRTFVGIPATLNVREGESTTFSVSLSFDPVQNAVVTVQTSDPGDATVMPATLTFTSENYMTPQVVTVVGAQDLNTLRETPTLTVSSPVVTGSRTVSVTVDDDDVQRIILSSMGVNVMEGSAVTVGASLAYDPVTALSVNISSADTSAVQAGATALSFTQANYRTPQMFSVAGVMDDDLRNEMVALTLSALGVTDSILSVMVTDDDQQAVVVGAPSVNLTEGGTGSLTVRLAFEPNSDTTVAITSGDPGAATVSASSMVFTRLNYNQPRTLTVTGVQDDDLRNESAMLTLSAPMARTATVAANVTDNDEQSIVASPANISLAEGGTSSFSVRLAYEPFTSAVVNIASGDPGAATNSAPSATFTTMSWATPQPIIVSGVHDQDLRNETVTFTLSGGGASSQTVIASVTDDDVQRIVRTPASVTVLEGATASFDVTLEFEPLANTTITVSSDDASIATASPASLPFTSVNYQVPQTVVVSGTQDQDLRNETVAFTLSGGGGAGAPQNASLTANVNDDDVQRIAVSAASVNLVEGGTATFTVALDFEPSADTSISVASANTSLATVSPATIARTAGNFATSAMVTVSGVQDANTSPETVSLTLSSAGASPVTITANVADNDYTLTVTGSANGTISSNPPGISCGGDCTENYESGTNVALSATPSSGFVFGSWSGACTGSGPCSFAMTQARSVSATFNPDNAAAALVLVSGNNQRGAPRYPLDAPIVVQANNAMGNPVAGVTVSFAVTAGGGSIAPASAVTGADGRASARPILGPTAGTNNNTFSATSGALPAVTFTASGDSPPQPCSGSGFPFTAAIEVEGWSTGAQTAGPTISSDGLEAYFNSLNRQGGTGGWDIWRSTRASTALPWGTPAPVAELNTGEHDTEPSLSNDRLEIFFSRVTPGSSNDDLWCASRASVNVPFGAPLAMTALNSGVDDLGPSIAWDGTELYFASSRAGGGGGRDIWRATRPSRGGDCRSGWVLGTQPVIGRQESDVSPSISADGKELFFSTGSTLMAARRPTRTSAWGTPEPVARVGEGVSAMLSADGCELYFADRTETTVRVARRSQLARIPAGTFTMGSPAAETARGTDEIEHTVTISRPFLLKTTEVTQGEWQAVMGTNPSSAIGCGSDCPVERITWDDAVSYANALSAREGLSVCYTGNPGARTFVGPACAGYRLPSEAEWEYAARAGTITAFSGGAIVQTGCAVDPVLDAAGWYCGNATSAIHPVAGKQPNRWGLYDIHGNAREWVHDFYAGYPAGAATDPFGPATGTAHVTRGGGWNDTAQSNRAADREFEDVATFSGRIGFRVARTLPAPAAPLSTMTPYRAGMGAVVSGDNLYLIGGVGTSQCPDAHLADVRHARIAADGAVSPWFAATPLPGPRNTYATVANNGFVYVIGGTTSCVGGGRSADVLFAAVNADGSLGNWIATQSLPEARSDHAAAVWNNRIYVLGGSSGSAMSSVIHAAINADGTLGPWISAGQDLPSPRYSLAATAGGGYLFALGGYQAQAMDAVVSAPIMPNGTLGSWSATTPLPARRFLLNAIADSGHIYITGGATDGNGIDPTNTVHVATIGANGSLGTWRLGSPFGVPRHSHAAVAHGGYLYVMAGTPQPADGSSGFQDGRLGDLQRAPLMAGGGLGPWSLLSHHVPHTADSACVALLHFDREGPLVQGCGGGQNAVLGGDQSFAPTIGRTGVLGSALRGTGTSEEAWIDTGKPGPRPPSGTIEMIIRKRGDAYAGAGTRPYAVLYADQDISAQETGMRFLVYNDGRLELSTNGATSAGSTFAISPAGTIRNNRWYHVAATVGPGGIRLYVDGAELQSMFNGTPNWVASSLTGWVGAGREGSSNNAIYRFSGDIDEVRVSNVVRARPVPATFAADEIIDDFSRADGSVDNGWVRQSGTWTIDGQQVRGVGNNTGEPQDPSITRFVGHRPRFRITARLRIDNLAATPALFMNALPVAIAKGTSRRGLGVWVNAQLGTMTIYRDSQSLATDAAPIVSGQDYRLLLAFDGSTLTSEIETLAGTLIGSASAATTDTDLSWDNIGLGVNVSGATNRTIWFDDITAESERGSAIFPCLPESDAAFCARRGASCGNVSGADNCGTARTVLRCGGCSAPQSCGGGGTPNVCGGDWRPFAAQNTANLYGVWGTAPNDMWVVGAGTAAYSARWNGIVWDSSGDPGGSTRLDSIWGFSSTILWSVGGQTGSTFQRNGNLWQTIASPANAALWAIWGPNPNDIWAVGGPSSMNVVHWDGLSWSNVPSTTSARLIGVWGISSSDVWAVGTGGTVIRWNGVSWSPVNSGTGRLLYEAWGATANDVWIVGETGTLLRWNGSVLSPVDPGTSNGLHSIWGASPNDIWAVGQNGTIAHWDGAAWTLTTRGSQPFQAMFGLSARDIWAVGDNGTMYRFTP